MALFITQRRSIAGLFVDATVEERYTSGSTVTENPVEFGININDHKIRRPEKYVMSGRVSDNPLPLGFSDSWNNGTGETRSKSAWSILKALKDEGGIIVIESGLQRYDDMTIESLTAQQNAEKAHVLDFVAECKQLIIVSTQETVVGSPQSGDVEEQAVGNVERAAVQAKALDEVKERTAVLKILQFFGLFN